MKFLLVLLVFQLDGSFDQPKVIEVPTAELCWQTAAKYIKDEPAKHNGAYLGAGCIAKNEELK